MMSNEKMGGPAFPVGSGDMRDPTGMTLWDYYAGAALTGYLTDPCATGNFAVYARDAANQADAMIAERAKRMDEPESFSPSPHCETPGKCREDGFCDDAWRCVLIAPTAGG